MLGAGSHFPFLTPDAARLWQYPHPHLYLYSTCSPICVARYQPAPAAAGLLFSPPKGEPQLIHLTFPCMQHALPFPSTKSQKKQPPPCSSYFFFAILLPPSLQGLVP